MAASALGALGMLAWPLRIDLVLRVVSGLPAMNLTTAACILATGLMALALAGPGEPLRRRGIVRGLGASVVFIVGMRLLEDLSGLPLGIDAILHRGSSEGPLVDRMAPNTAASLGLLAIAGVLQAEGQQASAKLAQLTALLTGLIAMFSLTGYAFSVLSLAGVGPEGGMALSTAIAVLLLATAIFVTHPRVGLMRLLVSESASGRFGRRTIPALLALPMVVAWLLLGAEDAGYFGRSTTIALTVVSTFAGLVAVLAGSAEATRRLEEASEQVARRLELVRRGRRRIYSAAGLAHDLLYTLDPRTGIRSWLCPRPEGERPTDADIWASVVAGERERVREEVSQRLARGEPYQVEYAMRRADGSVARWIDRGRPVEDGDWVGACTDVTELRDTQDKLDRARRLALVGRVAGGVVHDLSNLLQVIAGNLELLVEDLRDPQAKELGDIRVATTRAAALTRQLLAVGRQRSARRGAVDLAEELEAFAERLEPLLPGNIELELELEPGLPTIDASPDQLEQLLLNLSLNARDAMPTGGRLRLGLRRAGQGEGEGGPAVEAVELSVRDTGVGMDRATRERIFEPLFTTKAASAGSGLGLSTVREIVEEHGASLRVESAPGRGSCFCVDFPVPR